MSVDYTLYFVLDLPSERNPLELARQAVAGGASVLQLRGKRSDAAELYHLARALKQDLTPAEVPLIVNDRLDVALAAGADGVHVGIDDLAIEQVRALAPHMLLGVSCYGNLERARRAVEAGADYLAFGNFYHSPSKPEAEVVPISVLTEARQFGIPVIAIGGITQENVSELVRAGADGIAVISAIQQAPDPTAAARSLRTLIEKARPHA